MQTGIIVFLGATIIVIGVILARVVNISNAEGAEAAEYRKRFVNKKLENDILLQDKIELEEKCEILYVDNVRLTEAVRELREINKALTAEQPKEKQQAREYLPPPDIPTNMMRCEPYRVLDNYDEHFDPVYKSAFHPNSEQYKLQQECKTGIYGMRVYFDDKGNDWYCTALAGAYGSEIGHCYRFTLENGNTIPVILADYKHPIDKVRSDDYGDIDENYDGESCISIIEFVVDMQVIPESVRNAGTMTALDEFGGLHGHGGNIVKVEDCGRRWNP